MITEKVLKLWFKGITEDQIKELQTIYSRTYNKYKNSKIDGNTEFNNIFKNLKKYSRTKDYMIAKCTMINKARLDIVKDLNLN